MLVPLGAWEIMGQGGAAASTTAWLGVAYGAILATVAAPIMWNMGIKAIGASRAAVFGNLMPVVALLLSALMLGEAVGPVHLAGVTLVLVGVWLTTRR